MRLATSLLFVCTVILTQATVLADGPPPGFTVPAFAMIPPGDLEQIMEVAYYTPLCNDLKPGFAQAVAPGYATWSRDHQAIVDSLNAARQADLKPGSKRPEPTAERKAEFQANAAKQCDRLQRFLQRPHPDPRFTTPEKTWATFLAAMQAGEREVALDCLDEMGRRNYGDLIATEPPEFLRQISTGFTPLNWR